MAAVSGSQADILDTAIRMLSENPAASMQDVARATGIGRATLYRHYPSRDDLIRAIRLRALEEYRGALLRADLRSMPAPEAIRHALGVLIPIVDRYRVLMSAPPADRADPAQRPLVDEIEGPIREAIERGQRAGELRADLPAALILRVFTGLLTTGRRVIADGVVAHDRAADLIATLLLEGAGAGSS